MRPDHIKLTDKSTGPYQAALNAMPHNNRLRTGHQGGEATTTECKRPDRELLSVGIGGPVDLELSLP